MFYTLVGGPLAGNVKDIAPENLKEENTPTSNGVTIAARLHCSPQWQYLRVGETMNWVEPDEIVREWQVGVILIIFLMWVFGRLPSI